MPTLPFEKYEGLGNDFVLLEARRPDVVSPELARSLCDRRRGVGADGVLLLVPAPDALTPARMRVYNADGSVPEMCGNGLRCVAQHLAGSGPFPQAFDVDTDAGRLRCTVFEDRSVEVCMGRIAVTGETHVEALGRTFPLALADAGNPHAIVLVEVDESDRESVGRALSSHVSFPNGTNVEFATFGDAGVTLVVYERGVGLTEACGTGACATVAVGVARGLLPVDEDVPVTLPGGTLTVRLDDAQVAYMRGPARRVFKGEAHGQRPLSLGDET